MKWPTKTITITLRKTGSCFVIVPSYASEQNVRPIKNGRIGMMILETIARTTFWNSSKKAAIKSAFVHAAASPSKIDKTSALITGIICGMESSNTTSGSVFSLSAAELIERCGISAYPETVENSAAPNEET